MTKQILQPKEPKHDKESKHIINIGEPIWAIQQTMQGIKEQIPKKKGFRCDFNPASDFQITLRIPYISDGPHTYDGTVEYDYLTVVTSIELRYDDELRHDVGSDWRLTVCWADGMPEWSVYYYDDLSINLLNGIRYHIDVTDGLERIKKEMV